jgi:hypothetical protein
MGGLRGEEKEDDSGSQTSRLAGLAARIWSSRSPGSVAEFDGAAATEREGCQPAPFH